MAQITWKRTALLAIFLFSGCIGPKYAPPCPNCPSSWKAPASTCPIVCVENWWEIFQDSCLNELEALAIERSPDLYVAYSRIVEARATAGVRKADLYPQATLDPHFTNQGRLFRIYGIEPGIIPGLPTTTFRIHQLDYYFPLDMSYEIDLWGRLKREYLAAALQAESVAQDFCVTLLALTTDLASYYYNARTLDSEIAYYEREIALQKENLQLIKKRFEEGLISYLDVTSAELELANLEGANLDLIRQRRLFENAIAVLMGLPASNYCLPPSLLIAPPPIIPPGIPCSILTKRPDILEAERMRASKHASVGAAYASFLPTITLTGILGFYSPTLRDFMTWRSRWWEIGGSVSQTIFDGCRKLSNLHAAWAQFHEADGEYQQKVLAAFREVEDALNNIDLYMAEYETYRRGVESAEKRLILSQERYREGLSTYLEVIDSERSAVNAEFNAINSLGASYQSTIQLIKAIGGSWCTSAITNSM